MAKTQIQGIDTPDAFNEMIGFAGWYDLGKKPLIPI